MDRSCRTGLVSVLKTCIGETRCLIIAETWFHDGDSHDLADPVQVWEKTHNSSDP